MNNYRRSNYIIEIKLNGNEMLLVHGYTGAVAVVPIHVSDFLRSLKGPDNTRSMLKPPSESMLDRMKQDGFMTDFTQEEEKDFIIKINKNMHKSRIKSRPSYMLVPTYSCNFDCLYCYQKNMRNSHDNNYIEKIMTKEMADIICLGIQNIEKDSPWDGKNEMARDITFYGGEPLQSKTLDAVSYAVEKIKSVCGDTTFSAISNGYELDLFKDLLGDHGISEIQITLDSVFNIHDKRRVVKDKAHAGSYKKITENITLALDSGVGVNLRINTDRESLEYFYEFADEIEKRGWCKYENFKADFAPVFKPHEKEKKENKEKELNYGTLFKEINTLRNKLPESKKPVYKVSEEDYLQSMKGPLFYEKSLADYFKSSICNAMTTMYIFDPYGKIYTCFEMVGVEEEAISELDENGKLTILDDAHTRWRERFASSNPVCGSCSYTLFCGGGCAARAMSRTGNIYSNYCNGFRMFFNEKVREIYLENEQEKNKEIGVKYTGLLPEYSSPVQYKPGQKSLHK